MKILIVGGGTMGFLVAEYFMREGHDVTVIEKYKSRLKALQDRLDITVLHGHATDVRALNEANIKGIDLFLALTDDDEANIIACTLAKNAGVSQKVARLNEAIHFAKENAGMLKDAGVDEILDVEDSLIDEIKKLVSYPGAADIKHFVEKKYVVGIFSFDRKSPYYEKKLGEISFPFPVQALAYMKASDVLPYRGDVIINEFVYVYYAFEAQHLDAVHKVLYPNNRSIQKVMIYGGGYKSTSTSIELADLLSQSTGVKHATLVLDDEKEAEYASARGSYPLVVGDPSKPYFAQAENMKSYDAFMAISSNFEKNLFSCSVAYRELVPYTFSLVRYPEHVNFVSTIPITSFLNPAMIAANKILRFHKADTIISRTIFNYKEIECLEFAVKENCLFSKKSIKSLPFKNSKVIAVRRGEAFLALTDDLVIQPGDTVLLFLFEVDKEIIRKAI